MQLFSDVIEQLEARTAKNPDTGCWEWQGVRLPKGYGQISINSRHYYVHRIAFQIFKGPLEPGRHVCHKCDNPPCWNPDHLFSGTNTDNRQDSVNKGRHSHGITHVWAKLDEPTVLAIRADWADGATRQDLAAKYGIPAKTIEKVVYRVSWKALGGAESERHTTKGERNTFAKILESTAQAILDGYRSGTSVRNLCRQFGLPRSTVAKIAYRATWKHLP